MMKKIVAVLLIVALALAVLAGCKGPKRTYVDEDGTKVEVQGDGDTVVVTNEDGESSAVSGSNLAWPKGKMGDLPELKGNIIQVLDTPEGQQVSLADIKKSDYDAYVSKVKSLGYETVYDMEIDDSTHLFAGEKGDFSVMIQFGGDSGDKGLCVITYMLGDS